MPRPIVFSGIQPTGNLHIGNYLGALSQWVDLQKRADCLCCVVDLHAVTVPQDPKSLRERVRTFAALYLASGVSPDYALLFVQSDVPAHTQLAWMLGTLAGVGQLARMTQFKEKLKRHFGESGVEHLFSEKEDKKLGSAGRVPFGLFAYPVLMAADILLYQTDQVPVGEDQKQHVELTRDLAGRFNAHFGPVFKLPRAVLRKEGGRIMALDDPSKKMSKTAESSWNYIALLDSPETVRRKIRKAVTDSGTEVKYAPDKPAMKNLLTMYRLITGESISAVEREYAGKGYGAFKDGLAGVIIDFLRPLQERYKKIRRNERKLEMLLEAGAMHAAERAEPTLDAVREGMGLG